MRQLGTETDPAKWARNQKVLSPRDLTPAQNARKTCAVGAASGKSLQSWNDWWRIARSAIEVGKQWCCIILHDVTDDPVHSWDGTRNTDRTRTSVWLRRRRGASIRQCRSVYRPPTRRPACRRVLAACFPSEVGREIARSSASP
jgi:hypothetical protein